MTLKRNATLRTSSQFSYVFDDAGKIYGEHFTVLFRLNDVRVNRLGLIVPKKHTGNAIVRNTVRRIVKESFKSKFKQDLGVDIVVLSKRGIKIVDRATYKAILRHAIDKQFDKLFKKLI